ncbi:hypothetical protein A3E95_01820 [Candidatus Nomurabacteria bacterium RIFCSPHIGHO2_12_FULL_44_22b]|nr:MAG: hypothetical protein A3E95_01820 [Candidatus Nomurabacteria bacterium RIFCSPHIGHO2_12_FULL_44_22b]
MKIDFVRHGKTEYNVAGRVNGQMMDDPLIEEGIEQAQKTKLEISEDYTIIYSSDLLRAKQTAEILNQKLNIPIKYDVRLRERSHGSLTGKTWDEMGPNQKEIDKNQKYDYRPYGGECVEDVRSRVFSFVEEIKKNNRNPKILVVTHGGIIRLLYHTLHGQIPEKIYNASVHEFEFPNIDYNEKFF